MHAFLIIGNTNGIKDLTKKLKAKILEFPLMKIEDVRNLNNLIRLSFSEPTLVVSENIHEATEEALNAFLKNLEEPQENIYFALTAPSTRAVLPTIVSRCQIIRTINSPQTTVKKEISDEFLGLSVTKKLAYIDKIKDRKEAIEFAENLIKTMHSQLHKNGVKYTSIARGIETAQETLTGLKLNGNVNLHLSKMAINL